jgi:hypothetical protein
MLEFEMEHLAQLGRFHQLAVDAYGAQHAGGTSPLISTAFSLLGLHLAFDDGWTGPAVRAAHQALAGRGPWPTFTPPHQPTWLTAAAVSDMSNVTEHATVLERWARSAWDAWQSEHDHVRRWAAEAFPAASRARLQEL